MEATHSREEEPVPIALVLSEDVGYANTVRRSLSQAGFSAVVTASHSDAVDLVAESNVDVLLIDYDLAQTDGLSVWREVRRRYGARAPSGLVLGDHWDPSLLAQCISAGAAALHVKSDPMEALVERVSSLVLDRGKRLVAENKGALRRVNGGTDPLTGVASASHFERRLLGESSVSYRDDTHLSVMMIATDRFERLEQRFGREAAESALSKAARVIDGEIRSRDCVARYADHTLAVILPETPSDAASSVARRLRRVLAATDLGNLERPIAPTFSFGVAARPPGVVMSPEEMCAQALKACAAARSMGGDRVVADTALTGRPVAAVVGDSETAEAVAESLSGGGVEVRIMRSFDEAKRAIPETPVAMILAVDSGGDGEEGVELLSWAGRRAPSIKRVLVADRVDSRLMAHAVNLAAIHYFLAVPIYDQELPALVDRLLFS